MAERKKRNPWLKVGIITVGQARHAQKSGRKAANKGVPSQGSRNAFRRALNSSNLTRQYTKPRSKTNPMTYKDVDSYSREMRKAAKTKAERTRATKKGVRAGQVPAKALTSRTTRTTSAATRRSTGATKKYGSTSATRARMGVK